MAVVGARGRRLGAVGAVAGLVGIAVALGGPARTSVAAPFEECAIRGDLGHDNGAEVVVGVPGAASGAGAVDVWSLEGSTTLTLASLGLPASAAGDRFGAAVAVDDVDCNGSADLLVGAPGADGGRGRVYLVLDPLAVQQPARVLVVGTGETASAHFGATIATALPAAQVRSSIQSDVWIGAPGTDLNAAYRQEGEVVHYVSRTDAVRHWFGLQPIETFRPETPGVDSLLFHAHYGATLAASPGRVLIGAPDAGLQGARRAGFVEERRSMDTDPAFEFSFLWSRATPGVPGEPRTGDHFGAAVATDHRESLIGAPGVDVGRSKDAGSVLLLTDIGGWSLPDQTFTYDTPGVPGAPRSGDHLGAAVTLAEDLGTPCGLQAALGAPGRDVTSSGHKRADAGAVVVVPTSTPGKGCKAGSVLEQGHGLTGQPERGDQAGASLGVLPYSPYGTSLWVGDRLLVGAPLEDWKGHKDAGIVQAGVGIPPEGPPAGPDPHGIPTDSGFYNELTSRSGITAGQRYGAVIAGEMGV